MNIREHEWFMSIALEEAEIAYRKDEVPVGAVVVSEDGKVISKSYNLKEATHNPAGHAEILVIQDACKKIENWRLEKTTIYVTLEPCIMCLGTMIHSRINNLVFGAYDKKAGAASLDYNFYKDNRLNHNFSIVGGVKHFECSKILSDFFREKRTHYKSNEKFR
jgi:tRNA(adenine34) deaminase